MVFKTQAKKLILQGKKINIEFGDELSIGEFKISNPGEYEINNILVVAPEKGIYSIILDNIHVVYWQAHNGKPAVESDAMGDIDVMVLDLEKEKTHLKDVVATINELSPSTVILANSDLKDELVKEMSFVTEEAESWKAEERGEEEDRKLILLPCSQN